MALLAVACLVAPGCEDDDASPTGPSAIGGGATPVAGGTTPIEGATQVRGTERLGWSQPGATSQLRFRAYVDDRRVELSSATCTGGECSAPLPALTDGVHRIELVNVTASGVESQRSEPITLQKVSARASVSSLPLASARSGFRLEPVITMADGLSFTADIIATGVRAPAQLSWLPDGRLLLAEADGRVRVVRPGEAENRDPALDAGMLAPEQVGPMGIASHPDFAQNRFVYVSLLERERSGGTRLRLVRLREVGDTLGEAATLFEAPVAETADASQAGPSWGPPSGGPTRMAFGPDRLLYLMLPPGMEFVNEPAASTPHASMLRLTDEGRASSETLTGITASPLAFTWNRTTGALWMMFPGQDGNAVVRSLDTRARVQSSRDVPARLRVVATAGTPSSALMVQATADNLLLLKTLIGTSAGGTGAAARLAMPLQAINGLADRIGDAVADESGSLFFVTANAGADSGLNASPTDAVVRLTPARR